MAFNQGQDDAYHSFSILNGVMVKISDRFRPPTKITLPVGWKLSDPSELLTYNYDFSNEHSALRLAEEERFIQEKQKLDEIEKTLSNSSNTESGPNSDLSLQTRLAAETEQNQDDQDDNEYTNASNSNMSNEILTPLVLAPVSHPTGALNSQQTIDWEDFESSNQNPFELVELQTLNELDELRSVLDPSENGRQLPRKVIKSKPSDDNLDIDLSIFNSAPLESMVPARQVNVNIDNLIDTGPVELADDISNPNEVFGLPANVAYGTLTWTKFDADTKSPSEVVPVRFTSTNPFQAAPVMQQSFSNINKSEVYLSQSPPAVMSLPENISSVSTLTRTKSLPNLQEQLDFVNFNQKPLSNLEKNVSFNKSTEEIHYEQAATGGVSMPTGRIESIMKQYQFHRMNDFTDLQSSTTETSADIVIGQSRSHTPSSIQSPPTSLNSQQFIPLSIPSTSSFSEETHRFQPVIPRQNIVSSNSQSYNSNAGINSTGNYLPPYMNVSINNPFANPFQMGSTPFPHNNLPSYPPISVNPTPQYSFPSSTVPNSSPLNYGLPSQGNSPSTYANSGPMLIQSKPFTNTDLKLFPTLSNQRHSVPLPYPSTISTPPIFCNGGNFDSAVSKPVYAMNNFWSSNNDQSTTSPSASAYNQQAGKNLLNTNIYKADDIQKPNVTNLSPLDKKVQNGMTAAMSSWLTDETNSLITSEKNFAFQLQAMGFPLPCVSRTIKRLGLDEREVLDFLCLVQELREKGFNADDAEEALINTKNDIEKSSSYLTMVATFKELGFQPKNIHNALKETSCDQNKALDVLTR